MLFEENANSNRLISLWKWTFVVDFTGDANILLESRLNAFV